MTNHMQIRLSHSDLQATSTEIPAYPIMRYDTGMVVYQEALIEGQYLLVNASAMGRPKAREAIWHSYRGGVFADRPLRRRQHAFQLEADGQLLTDRWRWLDAHETLATRAGCQEWVVELRHELRPIRVAVHTRLDGTQFLVRWLEITNEGDEPAALSAVSPWSGQVWERVGHPWVTTPLSAFPEGAFSVGRYTDTQPGAEGCFDWSPLPPGRYAFDTLHGRSGWGTPFCMLRNEVTGELAVIHLAWSGNWEMEFINDDEPNRYAGHNVPRDACLYARIGMAGPAPLRVLEPSETAKTPAVHIGFLFGGLDEGVQALHTHLRQSVMLPLPAGRENRVEVNHTGFTMNAQVTEAQLYEDIDVAADAGAELFMLDAGWFGSENATWAEVVGDWDQESPLLVSGVKAAFDRVRKRGMLTGLWVEAERMGPASRALRRHPDWQMTRRGSSIPNLDLSKPEVAEHLESTIVDIIERYELDCFRLDYNISVGEGGEVVRGGYAENTLWRYYDALYGIFDRIHRRFPNLLLENCSSGGGRMDLGMLSRFHWTQLTDKWSPAPTLKIVNGTTLCLPPERCETILGAIAEGVADLNFMLRVGLFGHMCLSGIYPTMAERHIQSREHWLHAISLYKAFVRPMLPTCRMFHHTPIQRQTERGDWVVLECASEDAGRAYVGVFRLNGAREDTYRLRPRGLDAGKSYRVTYDSAGWCRELGGGALMDEGLLVRLAGASLSELLLFEAI